jgi:hypothetical protein
MIRADTTVRTVSTNSPGFFRVSSPGGLILRLR